MTSDSLASYEGPKQAVDNCLAYRVETPNESKFYHGQIMRDVAPIIGNEVGALLVETAGLHGADYLWDFNLTPPHRLAQQRYDMVITQAIFEHILNPYGLLSFLSILAGPGGHVIIHTHLPGFPYHKHPIDSLKYFSDWFEAVAPNFNLEVVEVKTEEAHLFVMYRRKRG